MKRRINIGLLIDDVNNFFSSQAAKGAEQAAKALDANLYIFPGHYIGSTDSRYADKKYEYQYNSIFNYLYPSGYYLLQSRYGTAEGIS